MLVGADVTVGTLVTVTVLVLVDGDGTTVVVVTVLTVGVAVVDEVTVGMDDVVVVAAGAITPQATRLPESPVASVSLRPGPVCRSSGCSGREEYCRSYPGPGE